MIPFVLSILAGAIGAGTLAGFAPRLSFAAAANTALGLFAGTAAWALTMHAPWIEPGIAGLLLILAQGFGGGILLTAFIGALRNIVN